MNYFYFYGMIQFNCKSGSGKKYIGISIRPPTLFLNTAQALVLHFNMSSKN